MSEENAPEASFEQDGGRDEGEAREAPSSVVFVDPDLDEEACQALGSALELQVRVESSESVSNPDLDLGCGVVVPWELPTESGSDVIERLRAGNPEIAIVAASPSPTPPRVQAALRAGATSFVSQPYDALELRARLRLEDGAAD